MNPPGRSARRIAASVADQGVAALTNITVVIFAARQSTAEGFAAFAVVYTVFALLLGAFTAYVGQALVLRRTGLAAHCRGAARFTLAASAALGAVLALTASALPGPLPAALVCLGLVLPVVLTQDGLRYAFSALRRPGLALAADLLRLLGAVVLLSAQPAGSGAARLILVWGLSAVPALLLAAVLLRRATAGGAAAPLRDQLHATHLGRRFVVEFGVGNAGTQLAVIALGALADPLAVGALRGAVTLFGPMNVLFNATTGFGPPLLGRVPRPARAAGAAGAVLALAAGSWATVLALLPDGAGRALLGATWDSAAALLPATGTQYAAMAFGVCALLTLRVLAPRTTLRVQLVFSLFAVVCLVAGYAVGGVLGAAWGLGLGSAAKATAAWLRVRGVLLRQPAGR